MPEVEAFEVAPPNQRGRRPLGPILVLAALLAVALGYWFIANGKRAAAEAEAAKSLESLGAIVVMDGARTHVASVNLSTVTSPDSLAKAIELLPALTALGSLDASRTAIEDKHLETIGQLSSLNSLSLNETKITDDGAKQLSGLINVESLYLASTEISDQSLPSIQSLTSLRILDLSATKVAADLAPLTELPQLEWLVLGELKLADNALPTLAGLKSLRRLSLGSSTYSPESLVRLQQSRRGLSVDR